MEGCRVRQPPSPGTDTYAYTQHYPNDDTLH